MSAVALLRGDRLPGVARLDRYWTESHGAPSVSALDAGTLAALAQKKLAQCRLAAHPSARWAWFAGQPVYTLWRRNREAGRNEDGAAKMLLHFAPGAPREAYFEGLAAGAGDLDGDAYDRFMREHDNTWI